MVEVLACVVVKTKVRDASVPVVIIQVLETKAPGLILVAVRHPETIQPISIRGKIIILPVGFDSLNLFTFHVLSVRDADSHGCGEITLASCERVK